MSVFATPRFQDCWKLFYKGEENITPKSFAPFASTGTPGAGNAGFGASNKQYFSFTNKNELKAHYKELFDKFQKQKPFRPSAMALKNPVLAKQQYNQWLIQAQKFILKEEPRTYPGMLYASTYGQPGDKTARKSKQLGSTWIKGLKIISPTRAELKLGNQWYTYGTTKGNIQKLMQCQSLGRTVAKLRGQPVGSTLNGITTLWRK